MGGVCDFFRCETLLSLLCNTWPFGVGVLCDVAVRTLEVGWVWRGNILRIHGSCPKANAAAASGTRHVGTRHQWGLKVTDSEPVGQNGPQAVLFPLGSGDQSTHRHSTAMVGALLRPGASLPLPNERQTAPHGSCPTTRILRGTAVGSWGRLGPNTLQEPPGWGSRGPASCIRWGMGITAGMVGAERGRTGRGGRPADRAGVPAQVRWRRGRPARVALHHRRRATSTSPQLPRPWAELVSASSPS